MINSNFVLKLKLLVNDPSSCNVFHVTLNLTFSKKKKKKTPKVTISHLLIKKFSSVKINSIRQIIFLKHLKQLFDQFNSRFTMLNEKIPIQI